MNIEEPSPILEIIKQGLDEEHKIMATTVAEYLRQEGELKLFTRQLEYKFKK